MARVQQVAGGLGERGCKKTSAIQKWKSGVASESRSGGRSKRRCANEVRSSTISSVLLMRKDGPAVLTRALNDDMKIVLGMRFGK